MANTSNKRMGPTGFSDITSDRISSLPDEILHHILSLMTAREAVQTCVLSTRWRDVWMSLRCIEVEAQEFTNMERFVMFMDNLLLRRGLVPPDSFSLMGWSDDFSLNHPRANLWVCHALRSNVRVLQIFSHKLFNLEYSPFISSHLKILNLRDVSIAALFIEKLFSGCPQLEELSLVDCRVPATKFSSRTLKKLTFIAHTPYGADDVHTDFEDLVIDTPSLVSLHLEDIPLLTPCLVNVSSVVKASFRLDEECFSSPYVSCNIISALSNVTKLKLFFGLDNETASKVLRRDLWRCQAFNNLKTLSVSGWCIDVDLRALVYFLRRSPALEKLTLCLSQARASDRLRRRDNTESEETSTSFNCKHLKKVKIRCPQGDKRVGNILNVILASASLPEIVINPYERWDPLE
ncbi:F-box protein At4g22280-like isoform X1 [Triticum urartu]|uniref:F-box domain-containing protein n=1 Tax=Triticum urartu TaxID=4572 RepID=A0A8R7R3X4_TRIUA|nr:F-box protein At4g22280-like isoform X1 [Triticum urartu]XP_048541452.1 F-box protein At4g22280-like isoform X2 [Triticum urartu]XP_048541454.1 F-box protein At4g22280-like isoform X1 [Triticum urartu]